MVRHPWFADVRAYIDLEGGGVGGHAMIFRGRGSPLYKTFASSPYYHKSEIKTLVTNLGNTLLKFIPADTDFSVYDKYGLPGMDI
ncbi:hypothetical protein GQ42DRAFT_118972, partial [Ramicandelaber brevisporus]